MLQEIVELEKLQKSDYRLTPQRKAVIKALMELDDEHPNAETIFNRARRYCPTIGIATVYRTLDVLIETGVIKKLPFPSRRGHYEIQKSPHIHFICQKCSQTYELDDEEKSFTVYQELEKKGYKVRNVSINVFGLCPDCGNK
ncbi:MAG: transcriptional repressor [Clostridia bacterium]|nr:transcriptional repressor [Clostridia bacterium]